MDKKPATTITWPKGRNTNQGDKDLQNSTTWSYGFKIKKWLSRNKLQSFLSNFSNSIIWPSYYMEDTIGETLGVQEADEFHFFDEYS